MLSPPLFLLNWVAYFGKAEAKRWQKVLELLYKRGRGWEDKSHMLWCSLWGSTGPKRLLAWFGTKPLPIVAERHRGSRGACQPHTSIGCTSNTLNFCQSGRRPRKHLRIFGGMVMGKKSRQKLHTGLFWFSGSAVLGRPGWCLGGFPRARNTETAFVQLFCLCPATLGLPGSWHWLSESLGNFPSKISLISLELHLKIVESCSGYFTVIWNGKMAFGTGKNDIFWGWKCCLSPSFSGEMLEEFLLDITLF